MTVQKEVGKQEQVIRKTGCTMEWRRRWGEIEATGQHTKNGSFVSMCVGVCVSQNLWGKNLEWHIWLSCRLVIVFLFIRSTERLIVVVTVVGKQFLKNAFGNNRLAVYGNHLLPTNVKVNFQTCGVSNYRLYSSLVEGEYMLCWCRLSGSSWHPA